MSFSKAKIQRFNDIKAWTPSPGTYIVDNKPKLKAAVQPHNDCADKKTVSDSGSTQSVPCFRTPTLLKRKIKVAEQVAKPKVHKDHFTENFVEKEALREKIVECENKDSCIRDLTQQLEEIKDELSKLRSQKEQLDLDKAEYEDTIEKLNSKHHDDLEKVEEVFKKIMTEVQEKKQKLAQDIVLIRDEYEKFSKGNLQELMELKEYCNKFPKLADASFKEYIKLITEKELQLEDKEKELQAVEQSCIEMQTQHVAVIERMKKEHHLEVQDIEFEMLKIMSELQNEKETSANKLRVMEERMNREIIEMKDLFENEKQQLILKARHELEENVEHFKTNNLITEAELNEKLNKIEADWKTKLSIQENEAAAILKECQAISEYSIIQCEVEKNKITSDLLQTSQKLQSIQEKYDEARKNYEDLLRNHETTQRQLNKVVEELSMTKSRLQAELQEKNKELAQATKENTTYQITMKNSQLTIEVLKRRLIHSDKDVEQLKVELAECEEKILEFEQKCLQLTSDLQQAQLFNEELDMQYESTIKLNQTEIDEMSMKLQQKVDEYRQEVLSYSKKLEYEKQLKAELMQQLHDAYDVINGMKIDLEDIEMLHTQYKFELEQSQNELDDYRMREMDWNIVRDKLEHTVKQLEESLEVKQDECNDLRKKIVQLEEKSDCYFQYSEYYQQKLKEYEEEQLQTENIHKKYIEMSGKFDELMQKFEDMNSKQSQYECNVRQLTKQAAESERWREEYVRQKEDYDALLKKYEVLEKQRKTVKVDQPSLRIQLEKVEAERDSLSSRVQHLENELKEVSQKYADLAGHQNNKQKIKHLVDLKTKNEELVQNNLDIDAKLRSYQKIIEKLKMENCDLRKITKKNKVSNEDKENFGSPNRSHNSSRIESPFRDRN